MGREETLIVIDDDGPSAMSLQALLEVHGFAVRIFRSAEEFLQAYDQVCDLASCLLLDLRLPGMSGLDLQRELAARGSRLPIVMISGHADNQSLQQAILDQSPKQ